MKFLLDECAGSRLLQQTLVDPSHDVASARDAFANASDDSLLAIAYREDRVLVTKDKDFGQLVFSLGRPHPCIVRLDGLRAAEEAAAMRNLIANQSSTMRAGAIIIIDRSRARIRSAGRYDE